ncbi:MAG: acyl-CoA thioesterase [Acidobacteria bacterium]|nr:MAG: acyl-CoA thioesterase [Acidobacteriota bacterium]
MKEFHSRRRVEFADTDMAGIVHFARFFVFMETAEHELLRALGAEVHFEHEGRTVGWPRVEASCRYLSPARLGDVLDVAVRVLKRGRRSMTYGFTIRCAGRRVAEGRTSTVCCVLDQPTGLEPIPIPASLAEKLGEYLATPAESAADRTPESAKL